jgi:sphingolipid C9-methyltransferase
MSSVVRTTNYPAIANAPFPAEGNGTFSNRVYIGLCFVVPWFLKKALPIVNRGGFYTYWFCFVIFFLPTTAGYWYVMSMYGPRVNEKLPLPNKPQEHYFTISDPELKEQYKDKKIPMQVFYDAYFDGKIQINGM